jgi:hypothetical protein
MLKITAEIQGDQLLRRRLLTVERFIPTEMRQEGVSRHNFITGLGIVFETVANFGGRPSTDS